MSNARFDTGHEFQWTPRGTFHYGMNIGAGTMVIYTFDTDYPFYRVDWASLVMTFSPLDGADSADMTFANASDDIDVPFLAVGNTLTALTGGNAPAKTTAQLALPFYVTVPGDIKVRGFGSLANDSTIAATISISTSYGV